MFARELAWLLMTCRCGAAGLWDYPGPAVIIAVVAYDDRRDCRDAGRGADRWAREMKRSALRAAASCLSALATCQIRCPADGEPSVAGRPETAPLCDTGKRPGHGYVPYPLAVPDSIR